MSDLADWLAGLAGWLGRLVSWLAGLAGWLGWLAGMGRPFWGGFFLRTAAGLIFFHMCLVVWCFGVRCLHLRVISCAFRVISRQLLPGSRGPSAGSVPGITLCPRITLHS